MSQIVRTRTFTIKIRRQKIDKTTHSKIETIIKINTPKFIAIAIKTTINK